MATPPSEQNFADRVMSNGIAETEGSRSRSSSDEASRRRTPVRWMGSMQRRHAARVRAEHRSLSAGTDERRLKLRDVSREGMGLLVPSHLQISVGDLLEFDLHQDTVRIARVALRIAHVSIGRDGHVAGGRLERVDLLPIGDAHLTRKEHYEQRSDRLDLRSCDALAEWHDPLDPAHMLHAKIANLSPYAVALVFPADARYLLPAASFSLEIWLGDWKAMVLAEANHRAPLLDGSQLVELTITPLCTRDSERLARACNGDSADLESPPNGH